MNCNMSGAIEPWIKILLPDATRDFLISVFMFISSPAYWSALPAALIFKRQRRTRDGAMASLRPCIGAAIVSGKDPAMLQDAAML